MNINEMVNEYNNIVEEAIKPAPGELENIKMAAQILMIEKDKQYYNTIEQMALEKAFGILKHKIGE